jgi:hypothetical protein
MYVISMFWTFTLIIILSKTRICVIGFQSAKYEFVSNNTTGSISDAFILWALKWRLYRAMSETAFCHRLCIAPIYTFGHIFNVANSFSNVIYMCIN